MTISLRFTGIQYFNISKFFILFFSSQMAEYTGYDKRAEHSANSILPEENSIQSMYFQYNEFGVLTPLSYPVDMPDKLSQINEASPSDNASEFAANISLMLQDVPESDAMSPSKLNSLEEDEIEVVIESLDEASLR